MLYYFSIQEFFHAIAVIPMQVLLLCLYYAHFIIEKTRWIWRGTNVPPTGICLSLLFIVAAVTDGQNVTVLMLVVTFPSSVSWLYLIYLLPCDNLRMHLAIIPAQCSNAFGLQLFLHYAQHNQISPKSRSTCKFGKWSRFIHKTEIRMWLSTTQPQVTQYTHLCTT